MTPEPAVRPYSAEPCYPPLGEAVRSGWDAAVATLPDTPCVLALDGPAAQEWQGSMSALVKALTRRGLDYELCDLRERFVEWPQVLERTARGELSPDDPDFAGLAEVSLGDLFDRLPAATVPERGILLVYGPGAALVAHDLLWYLDLPKRFAEAAIAAGAAANLAQPPGTGPGTTKRLFYIDWPILDRHRDAVCAEIDLWLDAQDPLDPALLSGPALRATLAELATRPFRTRPTFNTTSWGGHWGQRELGVNPGARNTALGYELIAPESGVLIGTEHGPRVEVPFQLAVVLHPWEILGGPVVAAFGTSFPIRFDYLDTVDGGNLSVHCHPQSEYMRRMFGWPYTQHETYYTMVGGADHHVYLGLRGGVDIEAFHRAAHDADHGEQPFDITRYVQTFPAEPHRLFLIPAGTPHGSGAGNVVLEVSATPYLYSLRFYDWLRRDADGNQRPVHVEHAFNNLNAARTGEQVERDLVQEPRVLREQAGWREELLGALPEMFFEVRRLVLEPGAEAPEDTAGRFHVLNVVEGAGALLVPVDGSPGHHLAYAETIVIPAAVGRYTVRPLGDGPVRLVKSLVR